MTHPGSDLTLGLRANAGQFALLVGVSALVGGMVGQERAIVPLLAVEVFGLPTATAALAFLVAFGLTKAVTNLVAGALADRVGRKPVLVAGWLVGLPVPFILILAPAWGWVVAANILLGVNQGLTWSTTVLMKIDLVGPRRRGLALGLNEASGYMAVALTAFLTGAIAESAGLRPAPFFLGIAIAGLGLGASVLFVRETHGHALHESRVAAGPPTADRHWLRLAWRSTVSDPSLSAASQAGLVNNLNDGLAWGLLPLVWASAGIPLGQIGILAAAYPATWGVVQVATGAWSDRVGRKRLIVAGMLAQAAAIAAIAAWTGFGPWLAAAIVLGVGTAMVYPTLIAVVADVAEPRQRGAITGIYRFWRDLGFAVGAILVGVLADRFDARVAILVVAALTAISGLIVAVRMQETRPRS
ncbi:MAG: MFS transporter [Chloroflexi bacterium RBG_16_69_14]|nr:MAG: MFS transporter [Chloroflexi bacterium RBG_16_69_14]